MRQAGRYMPEYRALREKHDFSSMYKTPEIAAEVTLQPIEKIGVDGAILFTDILIVPEAMGMELHFYERKGPQFTRPLRHQKDIEKLKALEVEEDLSFVFDSMKIIQKSLPESIPLIGFCGAPWTLATYMVEGLPSKNFQYIKQMRFAQEEMLHNLLERLTVALIAYAKAQVKYGAQIFQIFDTWAGILDEEGFLKFALPYVRRIIESLEGKIPVIYFAKGSGAWLDHLHKSGAQVIGLDWTVDPQRARKILGDTQVLQGNLDPTALYAPPERIFDMVQEMLKKFGRYHIANLGHGILPDVPVEHAKAFVEAVKSFKRN
jgi:uroporphyrinogen decarboxylase